MEPVVTILMAAYNGEKYISEQIESILNQTYGSWKLVIQDDCSTDKTCEIAGQYVRRYYGRISLIRRKTPSGSAKDNFFSMLRYADTEYIMTCDQDDVWLPYKIEVTLQKMRELEEKAGSGRPLLVHTDLRVADSGLDLLADSFMAYQKLDGRRNGLNNLLIQNIVTGCSLMINRSLADMVSEIPEKAIMHDWWFALIASAFGSIGFVDKSTVLYRQHPGNEVGAKNTGSAIYKLRRLLQAEQLQSALNATYAQAGQFMDMYREGLSEGQVKMITAYLSIPGLNKIDRVKTIRRYKFWKTGLFRRFGQILLT